MWQGGRSVCLFKWKLSFFERKLLRYWRSKTYSFESRKVESHPSSPWFNATLYYRLTGKRKKKEKQEKATFAGTFLSAILGDIQQCRSVMCYCSLIFFFVYFLHPVAQTRRRVSQSLCLLFNKLGYLEVAELKIFIRTDDDGQDWKRVHQRDSSWWSAWRQSAEEGQLLKMELPGTRRKEDHSEGGQAWVGVTEEDVRDKVRRRRVIPKGSCWKKKKEISGHSFLEINISSRSCSSCLQFLIFEKQVSISSSLMAGSYLSNMSWSDCGGCGGYGLELCFVAVVVKGKFWAIASWSYSSWELLITLIILYYIIRTDYIQNRVIATCILLFLGRPCCSISNKTILAAFLLVQ